LTTAQGADAARLTAINHLSVLKEEIGDLNKVVRIVKVFGMVNCDTSLPWNLACEIETIVEIQE